MTTPEQIGSIRTYDEKLNYIILLLEELCAASSVTPRLSVGAEVVASTLERQVSP